MTTKKSTIFIANEEATVAIGKRLGYAMQQQTQAVVIFLQGDLGVGKTTLCRGILRSLGYQAAVKSPTYTVVESYALTQRVLHHFDLYRLSHPQELEYLGIRDYFSAQTLNLIEWPDKGYGVLPSADLVVELSVKAHGRRLSLHHQSTVGQAILQHWYSL